MLSAESYSTVYFIVVTLLTMVSVVTMCVGGNKLFFRCHKEKYTILIISLILALFIGLRPVDDVFVDTVAYANLFDLYQRGDYSIIYHSGELAFNTLTILCAKYGTLPLYFTLLAMLYFLPVAYTAGKMSKNQGFALFVFFLGSFSFYSYSVNGLRQGVATSLILLACTLIYCDKKWLVGILVGILGVLFHTSTLLPFVAILIARYYSKSDLFLIVWVVCVFVSLFFPSALGGISSSIDLLIQDDRLSRYAEGDAAKGLFSSTGFRFDFLLYSLLPILVAYFFKLRGKTKDELYERLLCVYLITNSFWVIFIRANFSNRFAYLSWFLYPLVLAYPLLNIRLFRRQGLVASTVMVSMLILTLIL